jgi:uroporphyrinogen-III synthase
MADQPLMGKRVLVTRAEEQAEALANKLEMLGAEVVKLPLIRIEPSEDEILLGAAIEKALAEGYDWIVFTSVHGVKTFFERVRHKGVDPQNLRSIKFAVIGPATGKALEDFGFKPDAMPDRYTNEGLAEMFEHLLGKAERERPLRFLLWRAKGAREVLAQKLRELGAFVEEVHAYRTVPNQLPAEQLNDLLGQKIDIITFTSPSTVRAFFEVLGNERAKKILDSAVIATIGPVTEQACREFGVEPQIVASIHTVEGLVDAIVAWVKRQSESTG